MEAHGTFPILPKGDAAVIVANAAKDHARAAEWALESAVPVLVEKPLATSARDVSRLIDIAERRKTILAAAHVFLFAEYLARFGGMVRKESRPTRIRFVWSDTAGEERYGQIKIFDASVPVYMDVFPHILSAFRILWPKAPVSYVGLEADDQATKALVALEVAGAPCTVELDRQGERRVRLIQVSSDDAQLSLDFSTEPGTIIDRNGGQSADPNWDARPGPLSLELAAFLESAATGRVDPRLSPLLAAEASRLVDRMCSDRRR